MIVEVKFVGSYRNFVSKGRLGLEFGGQSVDLDDVARTIAKKFPKLKRLLVDSETKTFKSNLLVLVNGKEIGVLDGLQTAVKDKDEVVFVPVVHGG